MDLQQNERLEEWFLIIGEKFRETNVIWFYALGLSLLLALPYYYFVNFSFEQALSASVSPIRVNYQEVIKQPLELLEQKIFDLGNNTYSGYVKVKNPNSDWGVPEQQYRAEFKSATDNYITGLNGNTFILPFSEKIITLPRFSSETRPAKIEFTLNESSFIRPPQLPALSLEIQRRLLTLELDKTIVNAVILNKTPFKISRVDLPIVLYDNNNQIIGVNYTNINDLQSNESRSFQYIWYNRIDGVARTEIIPELNIYNHDLFVAGPGQNPFDNLDEEDE